MIAGLVVAGGYSARCGLAEKALLEAGGEPMLRRIVDALDPVVDEVVIDCRPDQVEPFETALAPVRTDPRFAVDDEPDCGPIAGVATGLDAVVLEPARVEGDGPRAPDETILASCDRPGVTPELFESLLGVRRRRGVAAAVPAIEGHLQPLCGAYETEALVECVRTATATGERRLRRIPASLPHAAVAGEALAAIADPAAVRSVDTPVDAWLHGQFGRDVVTGSAAESDPAVDVAPVPEIGPRA